ncbi:hypothetical protein COO91_06828 [Nostoc flagelliforme CCNUN1]|uniref:Uncharacterized protein n=1 Tax=Nostoc flagelliforme CCNUN1 TaxID=2038116 RepID=A0A2K8SZD8_9NOSO|nr:hypothetical protein COO91_06828 [Nostoc flagelliforme CCNUN1]
MGISPLGSNHSLPVFQQDYFNKKGRGQEAGGRRNTVFALCP